MPEVVLNRADPYSVIEPSRGACFAESMQVNVFADGVGLASYRDFPAVGWMPSFGSLRHAMSAIHSGIAGDSLQLIEEVIFRAALRVDKYPPSIWCVSFS